MNQTYLFYDLETSGLNKCFDQIIQFAAVRTDKDFNIIETENFNIRLRDDIIISPEALLVHKIFPEQLKEGISEAEAVYKIHQMINTPGTISLGYNTLGFDDEFLRFAFYRNLLTPYTHQFKNNCFRMDIYPMAIFYYLFSGSDLIKWPYKDNEISLKLENLASLNALTQGAAHDAFADVEATVNLAKLFLQDKNVWKYLSDFFVKNFDKKRCDSINEAFQSRLGIHRAGLFVDGKIGKKNNFMAPCLCLGKSVPYSNQTLWLRLDLDNITDITKENIEENSYIIRKKFGEPPFILPLHDRFMSKLNTEQINNFNNNLRYLRENQSIFEDICNYYINYRYPVIEGVDPDAKLYERGFMSDSEQIKCSKFHEIPLDDKVKMIDQLDKTNQILAKRLIFRNYPCENYPDIEDEKKRYFKAINPSDEKEAPIDFFGNKRLTPKEALIKTKELLENNDLSNDDKEILLNMKSELINNFDLD
ncbi:MAG: exonuclease domain-containing protein [Thermodesulfobacteriota bacterium]